MTRVLAVADEVVESLWSQQVRRHAPDLLVACGDLPFDYLEYLVSTLDVPAVFVPGNHDPDVGGVRQSRAGLPVRDGLPAVPVGPAGLVNADRRIVDAAGLRLAGLGGCLRYRPGPNQYSQRQFAGRARSLRRRAAARKWRDGQAVDILLTHAPPAGLGDEEDLPHRGFTALHDLVERLRPALLLHGHIHPHGIPRPDRMMGATRVCNVVGYRLIDLPD
ncbi:MAG TPA: metallophosphoesterase [Mycobacteriales bacterium]|jgi:Icc-related predicted phosphoesterase|nr:metallophosphoesterase [Mycobacteriales bacterium]